MYGLRISHRHDDDCPDIAGTGLSQNGGASAMASMLRVGMTRFSRSLDAEHSCASSGSVRSRQGRIPIITMSTIFAGVRVVAWQRSRAGAPPHHQVFRERACATHMISRRSATTDHPAGAAFGLEPDFQEQGDRMNGPCAAGSASSRQRSHEFVESFH